MTSPAPTQTTRTPAAPTPGSKPLIKAIKGEVVHQHSADARNLLEVSWLVLAVTAVAAALGWFAAGRVLRPLREMTDTARTISAGNLSERLALTGPDDEFKHLGDTLDDLLARLEASFESQRRFVANASHELRTPLTLERTLLQVALADPDATVASLRETCRELLDSAATRSSCSRRCSRWPAVSARWIGASPSTSHRWPTRGWPPRAPRSRTGACGSIQTWLPHRCAGTPPWSAA